MAAGRREQRLEQPLLLRVRGRVRVRDRGRVRGRARVRVRVRVRVSVRDGALVELRRTEGTAQLHLHLGRYRRDVGEI